MLIGISSLMKLTVMKQLRKMQLLFFCYGQYNNHITTQNILKELQSFQKIYLDIATLKSLDSSEVKDIALNSYTLSL